MRKKINININSKSSLRFLGRSWSILFLLILIAIFAIANVKFFTLASIQNVLLAATLIMLVGTGETFVVISGGIDLSPAYVVGLSASIGAIIMRTLYAMTDLDQGLIVIIGMASGILFSIVPGFINGAIIAKLKVPSFIVTLGTMSIAEGAVFLSNNGLPVTSLPPLVGKIGNTSLFYYTSGHGFSFFRIPEGVDPRTAVAILPIPIIILAFVLIIVGFILAKTIFGQHIYAIGGNINAANLAGIPVDRALIKIYVIASLMYGIAGMVYVLRFSVASPSAGEPLLLSSVGAVFIGGASMGGGYGNISGTVIGALIIAVLQTGLVMANVSPFYQYIAVGLVIIIAVLFDSYKTRFLME